MANSLTCRFQNMFEYLRMNLRRSQRMLFLKKEAPFKEYHSTFFSKINEEKYSEIGRRLSAIPILKLLDEEVAKFQRDLCYEKDKRLIEITKWWEEVFNYNTRTSRFVRAHIFLKAYCAYGLKMEDDNWKQWNLDGWRSAVIIAWCMELFQSYIVILDDIMDKSTLRRGEPCWYTKPNVGLSAINDALLLLCGIYKVLEKHFAGSQYHMILTREFNQANLELVIGQCMDTVNIKEQNSIFDAFKLEKYQALADYKSGNYSFRFPVHLAMHLAGGYSVEEFELTRQICLKLGLYFQSQDDRIDCFGPKELTGMCGNDIREGRLTWFALKFSEEATDSMKEQFLKYYGVDDEEAIANVLELYKKASLLERFQEFEENMYTEISRLIESKNDVRNGLFYNLFHQIRNRNINLPMAL